MRRGERFVKQEIRLDNYLARCQKISPVKSLKPAIG